MINMSYQPYSTNGLNSLQSFTLIAQFLTLFVGIMIILTKATAVSVEDGGNGVNQSEATVVAFVITILNVVTMVWPVLRKLITGDFLMYVKWAKIVLYKWPIRAYNKVLGVGGWCGRKRADRSSLASADIVFRCVVRTHTNKQYVHAVASCVFVCVCVKCECLCVCVCQICVLTFIHTHISLA